MTGGARIEAGSAARDAEQRNRDAGSTPRRGVALRVGSHAGRKFEIERPQAVEVHRTEEPEIAPAPSTGLARLWDKFRALFWFK
jgi:hypothetical protein